MAASEGFEAREHLPVHLMDVLRFLERENHDCRSFDYTVFPLDWVLNVLTRYLDTHGTGVGTRTTELFREGKEVVNTTLDDDTDTLQAESIFTGQYGRPRLISFCWNVY